jgi:hypothetical protein
VPVTVMPLYGAVSKLSLNVLALPLLPLWWVWP